MIKKFEIVSGKISESSNNEANILLYVNPNQTEKDELVKNLGIDEHTLSSALDPEELSRIEFEANHAAIILKRPKNYSSEDQLSFKVISVGVFLFNNLLIFVIGEEFPFFEGRQFHKINSLVDIVLKLLNSTIFHFYGHLKVINSISAEIEQKINTSMENKFLIHMFTLQKSLVYYLDAINSNETVIEKLRNSASKLNLNVECIELLEDILIENRQCSKQAEIYSNILSSLMDARASIVNNNLNVLIKTLTKITIALMVPTFVVSAFSVNVPIPFQKFELAFVIVIGMAMASFIALISLFRYKKW